MEITIGIPVYARAGNQVGEVGYIILDGRTQEVTHLVVSKGWLAPRDIVVARADIESISHDAVRLRLDEDQLERQPDFIEMHYVRPEAGEPAPTGYAPGSYLYQPIAPYPGLAWHMPYEYMRRPLPIETEVNVPEGSIALHEGMDVWAGDAQAGTLVGVRIHPRTERVTHLVISRGRFFPEERVVPLTAVARADEQGVHLQVTPNELRAMPRLEDPNGGNSDR